MTLEGKITLISGGGSGLGEAIVASNVPEESTRIWTNVVPMARLRRPEEITTAATFLACDNACFVSGHCLDVDGTFIGRREPEAVMRAVALRHWGSA